MIDFKRPELSDRMWAAPIMEAEGCCASQCNFACFYLWSRAFDQRLARVGDRLVARFRGRQGDCYVFPVGKGDLAGALEVMKQDAAVRGNPLVLAGVTAPQKALLEEEFPGRFSFEADRDSWDYIYDINRLADLAGKKLHAKRNHIHRFDENCPDWTFEPITPDTARECVALEEEWSAERHREEGDGVDTVHEESVAVIEALFQMEELRLEGGLIRAGGQVVAFSLGSFNTPQCFTVHFEKAKRDLQGAYAAINREMARMIRDKYPDTRWINREDDLGLEGLRRAKLSYYPDFLVEKYTATECDN